MAASQCSVQVTSRCVNIERVLECWVDSVVATTAQNIVSRSCRRFARDSCYDCLDLVAVCSIAVK